MPINKGFLLQKKFVGACRQGPETASPKVANENLKVLDLFSGIGGFSLGLERTGGFETVAFCEIDPFCRRVLAKHWPGVPIHEDIRKVTGVQGTIDVICGGFPRQPWSLAGKRAGTEDDRNLWPEMWRLIAEFRPRWVIGENVPGFDDAAGLGLDNMLSDLEGLNYQVAPPFEIPACAVDAKHKRARLWIVGNARSCGQPGNDRRRTRKEPENGCEDVADGTRVQQGRQEQRPERERVRASGQSIDVADTQSKPIRAGLCPSKQAGNGHGRFSDRCSEAISDTEHGGRQGRDPQGKGPEAALPSYRWLPEPDVGRVAHGVPNRVGRLRALGNAVVPQIPERIGRAILMAEKHTSPNREEPEA